MITFYIHNEKRVKQEKNSYRICWAMMCPYCG